jgi:predicted nucleotidyltransferase
MTDRSPHLLEHILGSKSKVAAIRVLVNSKTGISGNAIAKNAGMGLLAIQNALADLEQLGLIHVERGAVEYRYRLNTKHYLVSRGLLPLYAAERDMVDALARDLRKLLEGHVVAAGLFGSFPLGRAGPASDVDLFVLVDTRREYEYVTGLLADQLSRLTERYGLPVQPVVFEMRALASGRAGMRELVENAQSGWVTVAGRDIRDVVGDLAAHRQAERRKAS